MTNTTNQFPDSRLVDYSGKVKEKTHFITKVHPTKGKLPS